MGQKYLIMRIAQYFEEQIFNLLNLQIFFGFTFKTKLSIFKAKTRGKKVVLPPIKSKQEAFFFSRLWLVTFLSIMARVI